MKSARERILAAAQAIFVEEGLEALTIRRVAAAVGVTPMAIYRHYRDKNALVDSLVVAGFQRWETRLAAAASKGPPRSRLQSVLRAYREFALAEPRYFTLMFLTPRAKVPTAPDSLRKTSSAAFEMVIATVKAEMRAARLPSRNSGEIILLVWATAHGLIALHFSGRFGNNNAAFRRSYDRAMRLLLRQLRA